MIFAAAALAAPPPVANGTETEGWDEVGAFYAYSDGAGGVEVCTATLIAPRVVLTAAHCVEKVDDYAAGGFRVYFLQGGSVDTFTTLTEVETAIAHPDWNERRVTWDIAVASLVAPLDSPPAALGTASMDAAWAGRPVRLVGWGNVDLEENGSGVKREGESTVAEVATDQFTTTAAADGAATCPGDSGGAVFDESGGSPVLIGVVSWGLLDSDAAHPCGSTQGHARVDAAQGWIAEQVAAFDAADSGGSAEDSAPVGDSPPEREEEEEPAACGCAGAPPAPWFLSIAPVIVVLLRRSIRRDISTLL